MSINEISIKLKKNASAIYKELKEHNVKFRTRSESVKLYIEKHGHPRTGSKLTEEQKERISVAVSESYKDREKITRTVPRNPDPSKVKNSINEARKRGSKLERHLLSKLRSLKFRIWEKVGVDIYLPDEYICICFDTSIYHDMDHIWSKKKADKAIETDNEINAKLIEDGFTVIRVVYKYSGETRIGKRMVLERLLEVIKSKPKAKLIILEFK